jgi:hypothetical protein
MRVILDDRYNSARTIEIEEIEPRGVLITINHEAETNSIELDIDSAMSLAVEIQRAVGRTGKLVGD